jgi:hypothetical protein
VELGSRYSNRFNVPRDLGRGVLGGLVGWPWCAGRADDAASCSERFDKRLVVSIVDADELLLGILDRTFDLLERRASRAAVGRLAGLGVR